MMRWKGIQTLWLWWEKKKSNMYIQILSFQNGDVRIRNGFQDNSPLGTIPHRIKIKPNYSQPGPISLGQFPTRTTPHHDHNQPINPLIGTNTCTVGSCLDMELVMPRSFFYFHGLKSLHQINNILEIYKGHYALHENLISA